MFSKRHWIALFFAMPVIQIWSTSLALGKNQFTNIESDAHKYTCDLHVWTTEKFGAVENVGTLSQGILGAALDEAMKMDSPENVAAQLSRQLSPVEQERIIREVDLANILKIPDYRVVFEPTTDNQIGHLSE